MYRKTHKQETDDYVLSQIGKSLTPKDGCVLVLSFDIAIFLPSPH
jgi:hypothetical protein